MEVTIQNDHVRIYETGVKLLKIKSDLSVRIGSLVISGKGFVAFPLSALHMVSDMLVETSNVDSKIKNALDKFSNHESARQQCLNIIERSEQPLLVDNWNNILDPAQVTAVAAMTVPNLLGLCLFDEQGSGKTVMTIASFDVLKQRGDIDAMIVICPKSMTSEWPKDISKFLLHQYKTVIAEGDRKQKYEAALKYFDVLVTNYEGVEVMLVSLLAISSSRKFLLVIDESYYLKNSESLRSDYANRLRDKCPRCFVLCGTPAPNSAHDLINQFDLADMGFTFGGFKKTNDSEKDWNRISLLVDTKGVFIRRLKSETLKHVPEKYFHVIRIKLKGKQALMYEKARSELELELRSLDNKTFKKRLATYFQRRSALLQICSCPSVIDPTISATPAKYLALDELLEKLIGLGRKVVLWSFYKRSLDEIQNRYAKYNVVRVDGSVSVSLRRDAVRLFQEDPNTMLFLGNPAAAGAGITLHAAYDAIYISYSNQAAHYLQSLDRIHRRGQESDEVNYYLLVCKGTIEETEMIRLRGKELRQHDLLGDHIQWPTSLDDALEELQSHE